MGGEIQRNFHKRGGVLERFHQVGVVERVLPADGDVFYSMEVSIKSHTDLKMSYSCLAEAEIADRKPMYSVRKDLWVDHSI